MFVEERAMGEPYRPEKPYRLPKRIYTAIIAPIRVAIFCFALAVSYALEARQGLSTVWQCVGILCLSFSLVTAILVTLHVRKARKMNLVPPF
jgi:hypothetical protein